MEKMLAESDTPINVDEEDGASNEPRRIDTLLRVDSSTCLPGLQFVIPTADARRLGCKLRDALVGGRSGQYVLIDEVSPGLHVCLNIPELDGIFYKNGSVRGENLYRLLAKATPNDLEFSREWARKDWARNEALWGPLGKFLHKA